MQNLWEKDKKRLFRELYQQYMDEGYDSKDAKRLLLQQKVEPADKNEITELLLDDLASSEPRLMPPAKTDPAKLRLTDLLQSPDNSSTERET